MPHKSIIAATIPGLMSHVRALAEKTAAEHPQAARFRAAMEGKGWMHTAAVQAALDNTGSKHSTHQQLLALQAIGMIEKDTRKVRTGRLNYWRWL